MLDRYKMGRNKPKPSENIKNKYLKVYGFKWITIGLILVTFGWPIASALANTTNEFGESDTTHELMGQAHFPLTQFTPYDSKVKYSKEPNYSSYGMNSVFNFTHYLFDNIMAKEMPIPPGYIVVKGKDTLVLGPNVLQNDWRDLLEQYWIVVLWVFSLVTLIIIIPFVAVCYFCFCCCRRCSPGCPPCDNARDTRRRFLFGLLLLILIILLLLGTVVAYLSNKLVESGLQEASHTVRRSGEDTCAFLNDVSDHLHHLFSSNYEEMMTHLTDLLINGHTHIMLDLFDASGANALEQLERILDNIPQAFKLMRQVDAYEKQLRSFTAQYRDGLRGIKREVNLASGLLNTPTSIYQFLQNSKIQFLETSRCLHLDQMPNTTVYVDAVKKIMVANINTLPKKGLVRIQAISNNVEKAMEKTSPALIHNLGRGRVLFLQQGNKIRTLIDAVISDVHLNTIRSTRSLEDIYVKFGPDRNFVSAVVYTLLLLVIVILFVSLFMGCFLTKPGGASCLLFGIVAIFSIFSIITLVGLFYFMLGMVTYGGVCSPLIDRKSSDIYKQLNGIIKLQGSVTNSEVVKPEVTMSNAMKACRKDQSIFEMLQKNKLFDIRDLYQLKILDDNVEVPIDVLGDMSKLVILTKEERIILNKAAQGNLSTYHSTLFMEEICKALTPVDVRHIVDKLDHLQIYDPGGRIRNRILTCRYSLNATYYGFARQIHELQNKMKDKLNKIDNLILYNNLDFGNSIRLLIRTVEKAENFINSQGNQFIYNIILNLTRVIHEQVHEYGDMVVTHCKKYVGKCEPLAYIYDRSVESICKRVVDPINGFWAGVLLCSLLLLPLLFVAHRLMCLYKTYSPIFEEIVDGCPICTGTPFVPPQVIQYAYHNQRMLGGNLSDKFIISTDPVSGDNAIEDTLTDSKRKRD